MARQDPRYRGSEEGMGANCNGTIKTCKVKTGHVTRMSDERLPKKNSMENSRKESALNVANSN